ncbi:MAG: DUF3592 domain-containing protein [Verrucomicrobiales bacterium]|nr:DUF3592 domain-containing protein [Verrucomicrobiales bacterium]
MKNETTTNSPSPKSNLGGRLWKVAMGSLLILVGSIFVSYLWGTYQRASIMDSWVETPCEILSLEADDSQLNQRGMPKYILEVRYKFEFEGKSYIGDRIKRLPTEASDPRKLEDEIEKFSAGTKTVCFVNPENPSETVLKKDTKGGLYSIWFPCLFVIGGAGMIVSALFRKN